MSKYKLFLLLFFVYVITGITGFIMTWFPVWFFFTGLTAFLIVLIIGVFDLRVSFFMPVLHRGKPAGNQLLLTFDDGPDPVHTPEILRILEKSGIRAVFFCIGVKMQQYPELIGSMMEKGHVIGNHSMLHEWQFTVAGAGRVETELKQTAYTIEKITGKKALLFRPPFGVTNPSIAGAVKQLGYKTMGWSVRSLDTVLNPEKMKLRVLKRLGPGKVLLFHDNQPGTVKALPEIIAGCARLGYSFEGVETVLGIKPYL